MHKQSCYNIVVIVIINIVIFLICNIVDGPRVVVRYLLPLDGPARAGPAIDPVSRRQDPSLRTFVKNRKDVRVTQYNPNFFWVC